MLHCLQSPEVLLPSPQGQPEGAGQQPAVSGVPLNVVGGVGISQLM